MIRNILKSPDVLIAFPRLTARRPVCTSVEMIHVESFLIPKGSVT
jgi:hypothetical protein